MIQRLGWGRDVRSGRRLRGWSRASRDQMTVPIHREQRGYLRSTRWSVGGGSGRVAQKRRCRQLWCFRRPCCLTSRLTSRGAGRYLDADTNTNTNTPLDERLGDQSQTGEGAECINATTALRGRNRAETTDSEQPSQPTKKKVGRRRARGTRRARRERGCGWIQMGREKERRE